MFRNLAFNTAISGGAFAITSLIGLLLTPWLVAVYGFAGFGLIVLARLALPNGMLSLVDFGMSEVATQTIARAREDERWDRASAHLTLLCLGALAVGAAAALLVFLCRGLLSDLVNAPLDLQGAFVRVMAATSLLLPLAFLSVPAEGVLKGFERYGMVRLLEVGAAVVYASIAAYAISTARAFEWVCYGYLIAQGLKATLAVSLATRAITRRGIRPRRWSLADRAEVVGRSAQMAYGRLLGVLQGQAPVLFVSMLIGPAAAGVYDVLTRLPKMAKSILALINSTLLPVAIRLDATENRDGMRKLGETGLLIIALTAVPISTACMLFSREILALWIGPDLSDDWGWQSAMFILPIVFAMVGFGSNALLGRRSVVTRFNRLTTIQVGLQMAISFGLSPWLQEKAFIFGQVTALLATFPFQMRLIMAEQHLSSRLVWWAPKIVAVCGTLALLWALFGPRPTSLLTLALWGGVWTAVSAAALVAVLTTPTERALLVRIARLFWPFARKAQTS